MSTNKKYFGKDLEAMSFAHNYHKWILEEFMPYLGETAAEVGAGIGDYSSFLLESNIQRLVSFEPAENMFSSLEERFSGNPRVKTINAFFEDFSTQYQNSFDSISYINVLEHIEKDEQALVHAYNSLVPNGYILIFVPALSFLYSELDKSVGHFRRYSKKSLLGLVESAGFCVRSIKYFDIAGIIPWYIAFVLLKQTATHTNVSIYDKLIVPVMKRVEQIVPPPIGKNLILVAQK